MVLWHYGEMSVHSKKDRYVVSVHKIDDNLTTNEDAECLQINSGYILMMITELGKSRGKEWTEESLT